MPFEPVILWTDALIYILVVLVMILAWHVRRSEHMLAPWRRVGHSASGMSALTLLMFFVVIGLLDSVHFRPALEGKDSSGEQIYSAEVLSVFDVIATPLRTRVEKTYSAPLSAHLYAKETIELPNGKRIREFSRLEYGGVHLEDPKTQRVNDIAQRVITGVGYAILLWALLIVWLNIILARHHQLSFMPSLRNLWCGEFAFPWRAILITLGIMLSLFCATLMLASHYHVFGTDKVGQDVLYHSLKSIRTALVIGALTTLIMLPFALLLGIMAGYFRGWIDDVIQYTYTTLNSIPSVLLIAAAVLMMQVYIETHPELFETTAERADLRLLFLCIILGLTSWTGLCRLLRAETLKLREMEYIQAAHAFGVSHWRIISRHILPNVMHIVLISTVMDFSGLVLAEAVLSYVGVGVDPSMISFGTMINAARLEIAREPIVWWTLIAAFGFMFTLVLSANLFADAVQNAFDPRTKTLSEKNSILKRKNKGSLANKANQSKLAVSSTDSKNTPSS